MNIEERSVIKKYIDDLFNSGEFREHFEELDVDSRNPSICCIVDDWHYDFEWDDPQVHWGYRNGEEVTISAPTATLWYAGDYMRKKLDELGLEYTDAVQ